MNCQPHLLLLLQATLPLGPKPRQAASRAAQAEQLRKGPGDDDDDNDDDDDDDDDVDDDNDDEDDDDDDDHDDDDGDDDDDDDVVVVGDDVHYSGLLGDLRNSVLQQA